MSSSRLRLLSLLALVLFQACNAAPDKRLLQYLNTDGFGRRYVGNPEEENYVALGDTVLVFDALHPDQFPPGTGGKVEIDGTILLPELGAVHVAGMTRTELEAYFTQQYSPYYDETDIKVKIQTRGKEYFIYGEVGSKGVQDFKGDLTIFEAVMQARPDENSANTGRVRLIRPDPVDPLIIEVNIGDMIETGDSTFNVHVQELDIIYVPPTLLAQLGYFIDDLLFPVKKVLSGVGGALFGYGGVGGRRGGRRRGRGGGGFGFGF